MKKVKISLAIPLLAALFLIGPLSCRKEDNRPGFDLVYQTQFEIPAGIGPFVTHHFYLKNISSRYENLLDQAGKTDEDIESILTTQAAITGIFGDANFDFIEEISVRIYEEPNPNSGIEAAYRLPVPLDPGNNLGLIPSLADMKPMVTQTRFSIDVAMRLRRTTQDNFPTRLDLQFKAIFK